MSPNSNLSSINHRWSLAIDSYFSKDHVVEIDLETSRCVFRLPDTITKTKPQAYTPSRLGLGPYHHLRPEFHQMQLHKISCIRKFLGPDKLDAFQDVVSELMKREPIVRACYDEYLDLDIKTLARLLAVDVLYLVQLLDARKNGVISDQEVERVAADILMVENQIPVVVFKVVLTVPQLHEISSWESVLSMEFREFCEAHSPLQLEKSQSELMDKKQLHLLDRMYRSILINRGDRLNNGFAENAATIISFIGAQAAAPPEIIAVLERARQTREQSKGDGGVTFTGSPTAFELSETAGVKFESTNAGIRDIIYYVYIKCLQLPTIRIDGKSEIVLRNLMAYEAASAAIGATPELAEYLDLMCGLVRTDKDVTVLRKAKIIAGEVSDERVVDVFDGIGRLMGDSRKRQSRINVEDGSKTSDVVGGGVKGEGYVKKCLNVAWRAVVFFAAVAVVAVLLFQGFCSVFVCERWFGRNVLAQALNYQ